MKDIKTLIDSLINENKNAQGLLNEYGHPTDRHEMDYGTLEEIQEAVEGFNINLALESLNELSEETQDHPTTKQLKTLLEETI